VELCSTRPPWCCSIGVEMINQRVEGTAMCCHEGSTRRPRPGTSGGSTPRRRGPAGRSARRRTARLRPPAIRRRYTSARRRNSTSWATTSFSHGRPLVDDGVPVGLTLDTDMVEARVTPSCHFGLRWVDLIEIANDCLDRGAQAVEVEPVEAGFRRRMGLSLVTGPEPLDEAQHIAVSPHPGGNAPEAPRTVSASASDDMP